MAKHNSHAYFDFVLTNIWLMSVVGCLQVVSEMASAAGLGCKVDPTLASALRNQKNGIIQFSLLISFPKNYFTCQQIAPYSSLFQHLLSNFLKLKQKNQDHVSLTFCNKIAARKPISSLKTRLHLILVKNTTHCCRNVVTVEFVCLNQQKKLLDASYYETSS